MPLNDDTTSHFRASLHDDVGMLTLVRWKAQELAGELRKEGSPHANAAEELQAQLGKIHWALRLLLENMRMPRLGEETLHDALLQYAGFLSKDILLSISVDETVNEFPTVAETFFLISKEAIANAVHHGEAKHISLSITDSGTQIVLRATDDGHGFDPNNVGDGGGISYMTKAAESQGGKLSIESKLGSGTTLTVSIPVRDAEESRNDR